MLFLDAGFVSIFGRFWSHVGAILGPFGCHFCVKYLFMFLTTFWGAFCQYFDQILESFLLFCMFFSFEERPERKSTIHEK